MAYKRRRKNKSGFASYCKAQLSRVKKASKHSTRAKTALKYQQCLAKKGVKTGAGKIKKKKM